MFQIYLPIAELSVNLLVMLGLGAAVGFLSGMFGVGGGFLLTPFLMFSGIPPSIAVATGAKVSAAFGASTEFIAGIQHRAPEPLTRVGAEWAYRLYREPRRMAKRYLAEGPVALAMVARRPAVTWK